MILDFGFLGIIVFNLHVKFMVINIIILLRLRVSKLTVGTVRAATTQSSCPPDAVCPLFCVLLYHAKLTGGNIINFCASYSG